MKIDAAQQFKPTNDNVGAILAAYDIQSSGFSVAQTGIENCTLFVSSDGGNYVLRVYRKAKKSNHDIQAEFHFIDYLAAHEIPVAPAIKNTNKEYITEYQDWQCILMPKISGEHATRYNRTLVENLATVQARMHQLALADDAPVAKQPPLLFLQDTIFLPTIDVNTLDPHAKALMERATGFSVTLPEGLPSGLCHLDYDIDNILVDAQDSIAAVLDFDDLALAPFIVCLGYTLWDIFEQEEPTLVSEYLQLYRSRRDLTKQELELLPRIMLFRHYLVAALIVVDGDMDEVTAQKYARIENAITQLSFTNAS